MRILAIDFGTSNTVAAVKTDGTAPRVLSFGASLMLPSAVFAAAHGLVVGVEAIRLARSDPSRFEPSPKRRVDDVEVLLGSTVFPVVDMVSAVLRAVAVESLRQLAGDPDEVRLTHPASWGSLRRSVLLTAAKRAGLGGRLVLIPEPVAAAARFAEIAPQRLTPGATLAVYDLGGGTFDVALVRRDGERLTVLAEDGRADIGGLDFDHAILDRLTASVGESLPAEWERLMRPTDPGTRRAARALQEDVQRAKESLSDYPQTEIALPPPFDDVLLTRPEFEGMIRSRVAGTIGVLDQTLQSAGVTPTDLAGVFLVGGASRVPMVAREISARLGLVPVAQDQPETAVVLGALAATPEIVDAPSGADPSQGPMTPATTLVLATRNGAVGGRSLSQSELGPDSLSVEDATVVVPDPDRTAVVSDPDRTAVVSDPDRTAVVSGIGRTIAGSGVRRSSRPDPRSVRGGTRPPDSANRRRNRHPAWVAGISAVVVFLAAGLIIWRPWTPTGTRAVAVTDGNGVTPIGLSSASGRTTSDRRSGKLSTAIHSSTNNSTTPSSTSSRGSTSRSSSSRRTTSRSAPTKPPTTSPLLRAAQEGKVVIGLPAISVPGFVVGGEQGEKPSGLTVEIAREVARRIGGERISVAFAPVLGAYSERDSLADRSVSLVTASYATDDEEVRRAGPMYLDHYDLVVRSDSGIRTAKGVDGRTLCEVRSERTAQFEGLTGVDVHIRQANTNVECVEMLGDGRVDAVLLPGVWIADVMRQQAGAFRAIATQLPSQAVTFAVSTTDTEGTAAVNAAMRAMIADGTWAKLVQSAMRSSGLPMPKTPTIGIFG